MYFSALSASCGTGTLTVRAPARPLKLILQTPSATSSRAVLAKDGSRVKPCLKPAAANPSAPRRPPSSALCHVHFDPSLEQVRWFCRHEPPTLAASDTAILPSPAGYHQSTVMTSIRKPSPMSLPCQDMAVVLESVDYADASLRGSVKVHNLAFVKQVFIRITRDGWKTIEDIPATFLHTASGANGSRPGLDRFSFAIPVSAVSASTSLYISMCVCYRVNGQAFWDNNHGSNYLFQISSTQAEAPAVAAAPVAPSPTLIRSNGNNNNSSHDDVKTCARTSGFELGRPGSKPTPPALASDTDTQRYMQYSEARFSAVAPASHAMFANCFSKLHADRTSACDRSPPISSPYWPSSQPPGTVLPSDVYRAHSPLRASSPIICSGSPLAWPPAAHSATLLHC